MANAIGTLPSAPSFNTLMQDVPPVDLATIKDEEEVNNVAIPLFENSFRCLPAANPTDVEDCNFVTAPLGSMVVDAFEDKNARVVFSQKVISIVLLQTLLVEMVIEMFLYSEIYLHEIDSIIMSMTALVLFSISLVLMLMGVKARRKGACNFIILVYQPIGLTIGTILVMRTRLGVGYYGHELLEMICKTWKSCVFSGVGIVIYSIFCLNFKHGMRLLYSLSIATGVFTCSYICNSIVWFMSKSHGSAALSIFYANLILYPLYLYLLYDIDAMTRRDYRSARDPTDYINGAANLQLDFIFILINFIKTRFMKNSEIMWLLTCYGDQEPRLD